MKKIFFALFLMSSFVNAQDYMKKIAEETCNCVEKKKLMNKSSNSEIETEFGLCMIAGYNKYSDLVPKKDKLNFSDEKQMEKFGEKLAMEMLNSCPKFIMQLGANSIEEENLENDEAKENQDDEVVEEEYLKVTGSFLGMKKENYYFLNLKEESGKTHKLALLDSFDNAYLITDNILKTTDKVEILYYEVDLYDVTSNSFMKTKIITDIIIK